jgi:hypothetical protein
VQQQHSWLSGRFIAPDFNPYDGCTYTLLGFDLSANPIVPFKTWPAIETASVAAGVVPGTKTWQYSQGYYCPIARGTLGAALAVSSGDPQLTQALNWLNANGPYSVSKTQQRNDPTWNVVP